MHSRLERFLLMILLWCRRYALWRWPLSGMATSCLASTSKVCFYVWEGSSFTSLISSSKPAKPLLGRTTNRSSTKPQLAFWPEGKRRRTTTKTTTATIPRQRSSSAFCRAETDSPACCNNNNNRQTRSRQERSRTTRSHIMSPFRYSYDISLLNYLFQPTNASKFPAFRIGRLWGGLVPQNKTSAGSEYFSNYCFLTLINDTQGRLNFWLSLNWLLFIRWFGASWYIVESK